MEKKKLLKNKIVDTLPVLYLETVILMVLGQFLGNFVLGIPVGIAYARNPEILNSAFLNTTLMYVIFWGIWAVALFWIGIRKRNRPILQAVGTKPQGNNWKYLLFGLVLGFALNGFCILIAWLHHDIVLTYDAIHPLWFVVVFLTVFIQSSAEELLCRGFPWMCGQKHNIISILRKRHQVTSGAVQLCIRPRNGKKDILCNYSGQNEPCRLHPY